MTQFREIPILQEIQTIIKEKCIEYKEDGKNYIFKVCPICGDSNFHFYLGVTTDNLGLWNCFKCNGGTNVTAKIWNTLKPYLVGEETLIITAPMAQQPQDKNSSIPKVLQAHQNLMGDKDTLEYLVNTRKINIETIQKYKLGIVIMQPPDWDSPTKFLCIPHFFRHALMNAKFRSLPPAKKGFTRIPNGASILYNYDNIDVTKDYIFICEGELDTLTLAQAGESNVVGITVGAQSFNPEWFDLLTIFKVIYIVLDNDRAGQTGAKTIAERLGIDKCYNVLLPQKDIEGNAIKDINDFFKYYEFDDFKTHSLKATKFVTNTLYTVESVITEIENRMLAGGNVLEGLDTPWPKLNAKLGPIAKGDLVYLSGRPKRAKCLTKDTLINTDKGMLTIEEIFKLCKYHTKINKNGVYALKANELNVITNGCTYPVTHLTVNGTKTTRKLATRLGLELNATLNHPVRVLAESGRIEWRETKHLKIGDYLVVDRAVSGLNNHNSIVKTKEEARLLGYLIGDGTISKSISNRFLFTNSNKDVLNDYLNVVKTVFNDVTIHSHVDNRSKTPCTTYHVNSKDARTELLCKYDLKYAKAKDKCVPYSIRTSNFGAITEFIKAYFECEGTIDVKKSSISVTSASNQLVSQVQLLLLSLGIISRKTVNYNKKYNRDYYRLTLYAKDAILYCDTIGFISSTKTTKLLNLKNRYFAVNKKPNYDTIPHQQLHIRQIQEEFVTDRKWHGLTSKPKKGIRNVSFNLLDKIILYCRDMYIDHPIVDYWESLELTHYYFDPIVKIVEDKNPTFDIVQPITHEFTANGIVNHNTTLALNLCHYYAYQQGIPSLLFCLEMMPERLTTKLVCYHRKVEHHNLMIEDLQMTRSDFNYKNAPFYFGYTADPKYLNPDALFKIFELVHRKYGIEFFVFDNLQFLSRSITNTAHEISKISRQFKLMAMNLNCQFMVVVQPKRIADDQVMTSSHLKDSSAMEADADHILICHRKDNAEILVNTGGMDNRETLSPVVVVTIDRSRYGPGGATSLYLEGAKSYLREATEEEILSN